MQPVGAREQAFTPAGDEIALAVEHHHRMFAAVEDVDAVLAVDRDGSDIGELPAIRQLAPVLHHAVTMLARAKYYRHVSPSVACHSRAPRSGEPGSHTHDRGYELRAHASHARNDDRSIFTPPPPQMSAQQAVATALPRSP